MKIFVAIADDLLFCLLTISAIGADAVRLSPHPSPQFPTSSRALIAPSDFTLHPVPDWPGAMKVAIAVIAPSDFTLYLVPDWPGAMEVAVAASSSKPALHPAMRRTATAMVLAEAIYSITA